MRLLITGSRTYSDRAEIRERLIELHPEVVIQGGAIGADTIARQEAKKLGIKVLTFCPKWKRYGKAAGPIRNIEMIETGKPDRFLAFFDKELTSGTLHAVRECRKRGIPGQMLGLDEKSKIVSNQLTFQL